MKFLPRAHRESICIDVDAQLLIEKIRNHSRVDVAKGL
jgi:hypothetical protein